MSAGGRAIWATIIVASHFRFQLPAAGSPPVWPSRPLPRQKRLRPRCFTSLWVLSPLTHLSKFPGYGAGARPWPPGSVVPTGKLPGPRGRVRPQAAWAGCSEAQHAGLPGNQAWPWECRVGAHFVVTEAHRGCGQAQTKSERCRPHRLFVSELWAFCSPDTLLLTPPRRTPPRRNSFPPGTLLRHPPASLGLVLERAWRSYAGPVRAQLSATQGRQEPAWRLEGHPSAGIALLQTPGSGCLSSPRGRGQGALLQGALPLEKPPVVYQGLAAFGVGRRVPQHRAQALGWPWRWRPGCPCGLLARGGPLTPSPVASGSPSPGLGDGGGGGPGLRHPGSSGCPWGPGIFCWSTEPGPNPRGRLHPPEARALGLWHLGGA